MKVNSVFVLNGLVALYKKALDMTIIVTIPIYFLIKDNIIDFFFMYVNVLWNIIMIKGV